MTTAVAPPKLRFASPRKSLSNILDDSNGIVQAITKRHRLERRGRRHDRPPAPSPPT